MKVVGFNIMSQSPRFGSRCFVLVRHAVTNPAIVLVESQSPRFGSRCFVAERS